MFDGLSEHDVCFNHVFLLCGEWLMGRVIGIPKRTIS